MSGERFLLDSHILIWLDTGDERLSPGVLRTLRGGEKRFLSAATAWELGLKQAAGKLRLRVPVGSMLGVFGLIELPVAIRHGDQAALLPLHHRDPFDRLLIAQSLAENVPLVSEDQTLECGVQRLW